MPTIQDKRDLIAKMKLIPVHELINGQRLLLIDDSIVRGTQLRETTEFLYHSGAKEVHVRPACPPLLFGCKYLNFSRSTGEMELITRRMIRDAEGENVSREVLTDYANPDSERYQAMLDVICKQLNFTTLRYNRLDDLIKAVGIDRDKLCTYCWDGRE
jgi:amidophosphoribosyltransferase